MKLCVYLSFAEELAVPPEEESDIRLPVTPIIGDLQVKVLFMLGVSLGSSTQFLEGIDMGHRVPTCLLLVVSGFQVGLIQPYL